MTDAYWALHLIGQEINILGPVHTMQEEFENGRFILKTHQMLSVHTARKKFETAKSPVNLHSRLS